MDKKTLYELERTIECRMILNNFRTMLNELRHTYWCEAEYLKNEARITELIDTLDKAREELSQDIRNLAGNP